MAKREALQKWICAYKCIFVMAMILSAVPFIHESFSSYIKILLGAGYLLLLGDVLLGCHIRKTKYLWVLGGFAAAYLVTIILNRHSMFSENIKALLYMILIFALLYGYDIERNPEAVRKEMRMVYHTFLAGTFLTGSVCLFTYAFTYNIRYLIGDNIMHIGMFDNRLWGLYNPNTGATLTTVSIFICLVFFFHEKKILLKIFYVVNLIIQSACLILTGSRAPIFAAVLGMGALLGITAVQQSWFVREADKNKVKTGSKVTRGILVGCVSVVLITGIGSVARTGLSYVPPMLRDTPISGTVVLKRLQEQKKNLIKKKQTKKKPIDLRRKEKEEARKGGLLTGRGELWRAGIEGWKEAPIFGLGREGIYERCKGYLSDKTWEASLSYGGLHNIFLTILTASGIVGFLIFILFVILTLKDMLWYIFKKKGLCKQPYFALNLVTLLMFAITEMLEARILYRVGIFYVLFWMIYGYAMYEVQGEKEMQR